MLPKSLLEIFDQFNEDDIELKILKAGSSGNNFFIELELLVQSLDEQDEMSQKWHIEARGHRANYVSFDSASFTEITNNHPLLWEFTDTQCQLYFTGHCIDVPKLFYDLYLTHQRLFGESQFFNVCFGGEVSGFKRFQYSNGLLADGPKKLMEKYAECLKENGLRYSIIGERPVKYWNGDQFILEKENLKIMFVGRTYVIAEEFVFTSIE